MCEDMIYDILLMKQYNINVVCIFYYFNDLVWYELCNEYGFYVIDEINLEMYGMWIYL